MAKIQKYLPEGVARKVLSQRERIEGENKQVTVMFCDMEGYTPLTERLGPEEAYVLADQVYEILIRKVNEYGGTVNELTGDGIMALFGAPVAVEDAAQRAIRAALSIHKEMTRLSDRLAADKKITALRMRIGIHSGPVVVGAVGNDLRVEFKAVGDTVNLASRLEGLAEPGAAYVSEETFRITEGLFRFEALGERSTKGREKPVRVYRVIAPSTRRTRFDVNAEQGLTPLVGRERELELLLDGFYRSKAGVGQALSIVAEAGIGKSRLLYEFRKSVANEDITFLEGKCLSYSREDAYHPVVDLLKGLFDIHDEDKGIQVRAKVTKGLELLGSGLADALPYLFELLSVEDSGLDEILISPGAKRRRMVESLIRILVKGAEFRPLVIAVEDLHWMDRSSEEVIKEILEHISASPILCILTYRPGLIPSWGGKSYHSQVTVNRLTNRESIVMLTHLLGTDRVAPALQEFILTKAEGVPFFIEEFEFGFPLLRKVSGLAEQDLLSCLSVLKDRELLYERGIYPDSTLLFKHTLTREVVYQSLLVGRRRLLHGKIGRALEELCGENPGDQCEAIAYHYFTSGDHREAAAYSKMAARKAKKVTSWFKAIFYAQQRIACLENLPLTDDVKKEIIDARTILGLYFIHTGDVIEAKKAIDPVVAAAVELGYMKRLCQIYTIMGSHELNVGENLQEALLKLKEGLTLAEKVQDIATLLVGTFNCAIAFFSNCEFEKAKQYLQQGHDLNMALENHWGAAVFLSSLSTMAYTPVGKIEEAFQAARRALELGEQSGDVYSRGTAEVSLGIAWFCKGFLEEAERHFVKALGLGQFDFMWYGFIHLFLGDIYYLNGDFEKSLEWARKGTQILREKRVQPSQTALGELMVLRARGRCTGEMVDARSAHVIQKKIKLKYAEHSSFRYLGEILTHMDDRHFSEAELCFQDAIETSRKYGSTLNEAFAQAAFAGLCERKGDRGRALESLGTAVEIFERCGADGWAKRYESEMESLR
ncbi:MAG: adenylate/guanylate cyclase domain-containing protein [Acidobacteriota bacterium]